MTKHCEICINGTQSSQDIIVRATQKYTNMTLSNGKWLTKPTNTSQNADQLHSINFNNFIIIRLAKARRTFFTLD